MPHIIYGPRPGSEVTFKLSIAREKEIEIGGEGEKKQKIPIPPLEDVAGDDTVVVTIAVPSEADRREIAGKLLARQEMTPEGLRFLSNQEAQAQWRETAITKCLRKVEGLSMENPVNPSEVLRIETPKDVLAFAHDDVLNAIAGVIGSRTQLNEVLRGNSAGRSSSSSGATPPSDGTAGSAGATGSAAPARATALPDAPTTT